MVHKADDALKLVRGLLDQAETLKKAGLGEEELRRLHQLLAQVAANQGLQPSEGVAQFFETVEQYEVVLSLEIEAKRSQAKADTAKAEADRWTSEAKLREAKSKARTSAIDTVEKLMGLGIRAPDLPHWERVLSNAGVTAEELSGSLEKYGSMEALTRRKDKQAKELGQLTAKLEIQVKALAEQRDNAQVAVQAVREKALNEVQLAGQQLAREMKEAGLLAQELIEGIALSGANYGSLKAEAAALGEYVEVARVLRSVESEDWQPLPRDLIQHLLLGVILWVQVEGRNPTLPPPGGIRNSAMVPTYCRLSLVDALIWAMSGVFTEEERQAMSPGR